MKATSQNGAICVNYVKVENLLYWEKARCVAQVLLTNYQEKIYEIKAKKVVNATGPSGRQDPRKR